MTRGTHKDKWEETFKEYGYTNYELKFDIIGQEKVDFIKSAQIAFHPSLRESYGFSAFESLHSCPTILVKEYEWWKNFEGSAIVVEEKNLVDEIYKIYNTPYDKNTYCEYGVSKYDETCSIWESFINGFERKKKESVRKNKFTELVESNPHISVSEYYDDQFKQDRYDCLMSNYMAYNVFYLKDKTYISKKSVIDLSESIPSIDDIFS